MEAGSIIEGTLAAAFVIVAIIIALRLREWSNEAIYNFKHNNTLRSDFKQREKEEREAEAYRKRLKKQYKHLNKKPTNK